MKNSELICMLIAIVAYMLFVLGIGIWYSKRNKTSGDFYLGGRKLGPFVTANERGSFGYEQLAAYGFARCGVFHRLG